MGEREWFWRIVDANGLADLPSDEETALRVLLDRAAKVEAERLNFHAEWKKCTQELRDAHSRRKAAEAELSAAVGYLRNAGLDLKTGAPKATALRTIEGGITRLEGFLAAREPTQPPSNASNRSED